jgi:hypothetical protein
MILNKSMHKKPWADESSKLQAGLLGVVFRILAGFHQNQQFSFVPETFMNTNTGDFGSISFIFLQFKLKFLEDLKNLTEISVDFHRFSFVSVPSDIYVSTSRLNDLDYLEFCSSNVVGR